MATEFWWLAAAAEPVVTAAMTAGNKNQMKRFIWCGLVVNCRALTSVSTSVSHANALCR
eukprot:COSAG03_NODE_15819_length_419_cov_1.418750_2_plen_58_part_01